MTRQVRDASSGQLYRLETDAPVGGGGEALVYRVQGNADVLAKVYLKPRNDMFAKLSFMLANRPGNPTAHRNHQAYAWPTALICAPKSDAVLGFLMPRVGGMKQVFDFYNPAQRCQTCAKFNYRYLMQTARNIAGIMNELHSKGYVIGDVNQRNIFVSDAAMVTVIDTDSFQFQDPQTGQLHLCRVRTDGFIAPESYRRGLENVERSVEQDLFGLAVLIFHLLMEGVHPFASKYTGTGEPPPLFRNVMAGNFPHGTPNPLFQPPPTAPPFQMLSPELRALFVRCFVEGHNQPTARPSAKDWQQALSKSSKELIACPRNASHFYPSHLGQTCPWCSRVERGLPDSFPKLVPPAPKPPPGPAPARSTPASGSSVVSQTPRRRRWIYWVVGLTIALLLRLLFD